MVAPRSRSAALALAFALGACARTQGPLEPVHDLAALLPVAEARREVGQVDFGTAAARTHLASGWYRNEGGGRQGPTVVWSKGKISVVEIFLAAPRDLRAELRCAPFEAGDKALQTMTVELNGQRVAELTLSPKLHDYTVELPREAQVAGRNRLAFRYRRVIRYDHRDLAVSWDLLRLRPARASAVEPPRAEAGTLVLPFGTEAVYYLDVPSEGILWLGGLQARGGEGRLVVAAQEEGEEERILETLEPGPDRQSIELPGHGHHLLRLTLRAVPANPSSAGGLVLERPVVRARPSSPLSQSPHPPAPSPGTGRGGEKRRPNVIVYLVDTLRADRVGAYGSRQPTSPRIDAFARTASLFGHAVAQSPWTRPSVASILTGLGPLAHGVRTLDDKLAAEAATLPELLRAAGYRTAAFSTNGHVSPATGLDQGFDDFSLDMEETGSGTVNRRVLAWLDAHAGQSPFFLYIHTLDPHAPYEPAFEDRVRFAPGLRPEAGSTEDLKRVYAARGESRAALVRELIPLYDAEVAGNDRSFGALLDALRSRGLYDGSLVVFVSDHGEELGEHGQIGHAHDLYREVLDIPLIVKWPGQTRGERVRQLAQHVDLLPTILRAAGLAPPAGRPGTDLRRLAALESDPDDLTARKAFSHLSYRNRTGVSIVHAGWKAILPQSWALAPGPQLFRLDRSGEEGPNRIRQNPVRAGWLLAQIRAEILRSRQGLKPEPAQLDKEARERLRALGYL